MASVGEMKILRREDKSRLGSQAHHARTAARSIVHATALAKQLRAHGLGLHADNVEAAVSEFVNIVSKQVGHQALTEAMNWVGAERESNR
jgi:hypothetical protein